MVSFLNHIASILPERGLRCGAVFFPLLYCIVVVEVLPVEMAISSRVSHKILNNGYKAAQLQNYVTIAYLFNAKKNQICSTSFGNLTDF